MTSYALEFESDVVSVLHSFPSAKERQAFFNTHGKHSFPLNEAAANLLIARDEELKVIRHV